MSRGQSKNLTFLDTFFLQLILINGSGGKRPLYSFIIFYWKLLESKLQQ